MQTWRLYLLTEPELLPKFYIAGIGIFVLFALVTFINELVPYTLMMHRMNKNKLLRRGFWKLSYYVQTDIWYSHETVATPLRVCWYLKKIKKQEKKGKKQRALVRFWNSAILKAVYIMRTAIGKNVHYSQAWLSRRAVLHAYCVYIKMAVH